MLPASLLRKCLSVSLAIVTLATIPDLVRAEPAKEIFGRQKLPAVMPSKPIGFYSKGCLAGGVAIPTDGPTWQAMRLSRNRRWGHPDLIALVEKLSREAAAQDGWPGLLVGDISQPRGGPMLTGHASHQIGLDADIWLTPMPDRRFSNREREEISATSMLKNNTLYVDPDIWTQAHARLLMRAASYPQVERIFVHPGIKKKLCDTWSGDRSAMGKIRPYYGHHYHFHIRMKCPAGASDCRPQEKVGSGTGCDKSLAWWFTDEPWKPAAPPKNDKPKKKPRQMQLSDLPPACAVVADAAAPASEASVTFGSVSGAQATALLPAPDVAPAAKPMDGVLNVPVPTPRPGR